MKIVFQTFGNRDGNENFILNFWEQVWEASIPGMVGNGNAARKLRNLGFFPETKEF